jgi:predicted Ser/Thr protein kinase
MGYPKSVAKDDLDQTLATEPTPDAVALSTGEVDPDAMPPGTVIGSYVVRKMVASGGGGTVFAAEHRTRGERVAIKVLRAEVARSPQGLARFQREAKVVNLIRHPAIVDIREFGQLPDGRPFFVMELLEGADLKQMIKGRGRFSPDEMLQVISTVCAALEAAHSAGVVHRDLKASNIHVAVKNGRYEVKLLDFGIAKLLAPDAETFGLTQTGMRLGTASAMAPEQIRGESVDQRTDVYALGVLIYHMLTGRYPFRADTRQEIERMNLEAPPPRPSQLAGVPPAIDAVVLRCMDKRPERRFESARAVEAALRAAMDGSAPGTDASLSASRQAVGIYVDVRPARELEEPDEQLLDRLADTLEAAEQALRKAGLLVPLHTGTTLLAALVLPDDPRAALEERQRVVDQAISLAQQLGGDPEGLRIGVSLHVDSALVRGAPAAPDIAGAIVDVSAWPVGTAWNGIQATAAGVADLDPELMTTTGRTVLG